MPKQFGWLVFFNTKKKLVSTGFEPTITGQTPYPLELRDKLVIYLCNNTCLPVGAPKCESRLWYPSQGFLQTGACPCVFLRSSDIMVESLFESSSIIKHQASASINQEMIPQYYFNKSVNVKIFSFVLIIWEILEPAIQ